MSAPDSPPAVDPQASASPETRPPSTGPAAPPLVDAFPAMPERIGRYRVERILGEGGLGRVYLACDEDLGRRVAIKVPRPDRLSRPEDMEAYLAEARLLAGLDHPHVVPVHDVGRTEDGLCFVVSKFIEGNDLAGWIRLSRPSISEAAALVAAIADALHHAHKKGLVHRDVKPGNILLDAAGKAYLADFGLALREEDFGKGAGFAGTPAYMSPEQARGEGHRVDGRSDVFSLGVVFYELLAGRRPFRGDTLAELLEQITSGEPRPPRQLDDAVPKELERICLKSLARRASERYTTAKDMADDLRHFLDGLSVAERSAVTGRGTSEAASTPMQTPHTPPASDPVPIKIVPKGLRSFDAADADFFLELLPGPRDREGLPDSIRFWKARIEAMDADNTFAVGLIYGPSGCGKSSLVKAGLLPRLAKTVTAVYVECTAEETEARLLRGLRRQVPDLPGNLGLIDSLAALRRGRLLEPGRKVLLVLDQFEQWLHAKKEEQNTELVQALWQCDGGRVQCVVMVRDDFGMAATRFMRALDIRLVEGDNFATADLFDLLHARKVLAEFGRAYGRLPDNLGQCSRDQDAFLDQAVAGLAQDGKVISVRLALFAEMVKGKPWTPATLKEVGGTEGVGVTFLEETFTASTAPPQHRLHAKAAQAVLKALLPEAGTDIKGHMRSRQELLEASGYASRPKDFDDLLRILDGEIRLITPTEPEGKEDPGEPGGVSPRSSDTRYYQLTHDYLVPSLRDWLTRKQKETRRGRAELLLADRAAVWNARPENRQLPSLLQWLQIRWLTASKKWTPPQRKMMGMAGRYHVVRGLVLALALALIGFAGYEGHGRMQAHALRRSLLDANTNEVPAIVKDMAPYRRWINPLLRDAPGEAEANEESRKQLHASLALLPVDLSQVDYLYTRLLAAEPNEVPVIRDALAPHGGELVEGLWAVVFTPGKDRELQQRRLRAAAALAKYDPQGEKWARAGTLVVEALVQENPVYLGAWSEAFRPVKESLLDPLGVVFGDPRAERTSERNLATNLLAAYASDNAAKMAALLMDADEKQFAVIYPKFVMQGEKGLPVLVGVIDTKLPADLPSSDEKRETLAKRQANAAVALLRMNKPAKVWPLLKHGPDPRVRSYLIHRLFPLGAEAGAVIRRLDEERELSSRRALLLALGEFDEGTLPPATRTSLLPKVQAMYRDDADPGLHAAAEWLLRQWKQEAWLRQENARWAKGKQEREKRLEGIKALLAKEKGKTPPQWYVNGQGQAMVVIPGPVEFLMGSSATEAGRYDTEPQHRKRIGRTFAVAAKSVTVEQFRQYEKGYKLPDVYTRTADLPVVGIDWYRAAGYCNWLSEQEGIPEEEWCYETEPKGKTGPAVKVVKLREKYLSLSGYRLPTEAEMEYATRAGAVTSRYCGEMEDLLGQYAWYRKNSQEKTWPVGRLKPNELGLFDSQGNVYTWCQESYEGYETDVQASEDVEKSTVIISSRSRVFRGGMFSNRASDVRSANRFYSVPAYHYFHNGFRPARTLMP